MAKRVATSESAECTGLRDQITPPAPTSAITAQQKKTISWTAMSVRRVGVGVGVDVIGAVVVLVVGVVVGHLAVVFERLAPFRRPHAVAELTRPRDRVLERGAAGRRGGTHPARRVLVLT